MKDDKVNLKSLKNTQQWQSSAVFSSQTDIHKDLEGKLEKYRVSAYKKPISDHAKQEFNKFLVNRKPEVPIILDLGCGTGQSSIYLAKKYPECIVLGIDRSSVRLEKAENQEMPPNLHFIRTNMWDFIRLLKLNTIFVQNSYFLYPNPCPKPSQLTTRVYAHPIFKELMAITQKKFILRTNWHIGAKECAKSVQFLTKKQPILQKITPKQPFLTRFEEKYTKSGQEIWEVVLNY